MSDSGVPKSPLLCAQENCERDANGSLLLLPRRMTEKIEVGKVILKKGEKNRLASHPDEEEGYLILKGEGTVLLGEKRLPVSPGMVAYVPRNTPHQMECGPDEDMEYVYFACWP